MELLSTSTSNKNFIRKNKKEFTLISSKGFTLIEILLVMALLAIVLSFGLITGFDSYRRDALKSERNTVISLLQKARSEAINNIDNSKHGFYFDETNDKYIVFDGDFFDPLKIDQYLLVQKNSAITISGLNDIVFDQLTGNATPTGDLILSDNSSSSIISINQEGRIDW